MSVINLEGILKRFSFFRIEHRKLFISSFAVLGTLATSRIAVFVESVVLARNLSAADFGVVSLVATILSGIVTSTDIGHRSALVHFRSPSPLEINSAWVLSGIRGITLWLIVFFLAPVAGAFFNSDILSNLLRVASFLILIQSVENTWTTSLEIDVNFRPLEIVNQISWILGAFVSISILVFNKSIWGPIIGLLIRGSVVTVGSYLLARAFPKLEFSRQSMSRILSFSGPILVGSIIMYLINQGDNLIVGKILGTEQLGYYALGFSVGILPLNLFLMIYARVTLPVFASVQNDKKKLKEMFTTANQIFAMIVFPMLAVVFLFAEPIIEYVYGPKWMTAAFVARWTMISGLLLTISSNSGSLFRAVGQPGLIPKINFWRLLFYILVLPFAARYWGVQGVVLVVFLAIIPVLAIAIVVVRRILDCSLNDVLKPFVKPFGVTVLSMFILYGVVYLSGS